MSSDKSNDPLSQLPTWRLVVLMLASTIAACSALYLAAAALLRWPGIPAGIAIFCVGGAATALLMPPSGPK